MNLYLITPFIGLVIGFIGTGLGICITKRLAGKLRTSMMFLIIAVIIFIVKEALKAFNFLTIANLELVKSIANIAMILFIVLAMITMNQMINGIDNHCKKNHQKRLQKNKKKK